MRMRKEERKEKKKKEGDLVDENGKEKETTLEK